MHPDRLARIPKASRPRAEPPKAEAPKIPQVEAPKAPKKSLFDNDSDASGDEGGVQLKVNQEYAKRFEHNKKREERQRRMFTFMCSPSLISMLTAVHSRGEVQGWRRRIRLGV